MSLKTIDIKKMSNYGKIKVSRIFGQIMPKTPVVHCIILCDWTLECEIKSNLIRPKSYMSCPCSRFQIIVKPFWKKYYVLV